MISERDTRTWIEINRAAVAQNVATIRGLLSPKTALWAVVKSNAYGHGIFVFPKLLAEFGVDGFCVDTLMEGMRLREMGITQPILVLGLTLPNLFDRAREHDIAITISNFDILNHYCKVKNPPAFHLKIDTGMHRQGFYVGDLNKVILSIKNHSSSITKLLTGVYTHFASAKDLNYPAYTEMQFQRYGEAVRLLKNAGFKNIIQHVAATGGALANKKYHLDAVRIGIGLYGLWPSKELEMQTTGIIFSPTLSWHTIIGEIKSIERGDYVGYELMYRAPSATRIAILPVGYWHSFTRLFFGVGEVLIRGKRCRVIGRISMDMIAVDIGNVVCKFGDTATLIGAQGKERITAEDLARMTGTSSYEIVTRINPLIERVVI